MKPEYSCECRVCRASADHNYFQLREMYFGTRELFDYFECGSCGTIQICSIPNDMERHYPQDYYSFSGNSFKSSSPLERLVRRQRSDSWLGNSSLFGKLLAKLSTRKPPYLDWFSGMPLTTNSQIVDVGCGSGALLLKMQRDGFQKLSGLDPFVAENIYYSGGMTIYKRSLAESDEHYDLIMLHHAFEHMPDPLAVMLDIAKHLKPEGRALLRQPIAGGYAWRTYGENWYALDPPRHLVIPTVRAMYFLAKAAGLEVERYFFDSDVGQFLASEAYQQGIPLTEQMRLLPTRTESEMARLRILAAELNSKNDGDSGGFILKRLPMASVL